MKVIPSHLIRTRSLLQAIKDMPPDKALSYSLKSYDKMERRFIKSQNRLQACEKQRDAALSEINRLNSSSKFFSFFCK